jgi:hypothetical protein
MNIKKLISFFLLLLFIIQYLINNCHGVITFVKRSQSLCLSEDLSENTPVLLISTLTTTNTGYEYDSDTVQIRITDPFGNVIRDEQVKPQKEITNRNELQPHYVHFTTRTDVGGVYEMCYSLSGRAPHVQLDVSVELDDPHHETEQVETTDRIQSKYFLFIICFIHYHGYNYKQKKRFKNLN